MNERPSEFTLDEYTYELAEVEDRWYEPEAIYFRVRTTEGKRYILPYDESEDEWSLQSGFDAEELLARPGIRLVTVEADVIRRAEEEIESCEHCNPEGAEIPFDAILDHVTASDPSVTDYVLESAARCPNCRRPGSGKDFDQPR